NCCVFPRRMFGFAGVTAIDCKVTTGAVTVSSVEAVTPLIDAVMVEVPAATPVARPAVLIVAVAGVAGGHVAWVVRCCVELSEKVPVAVNCCVAPRRMLGLVGATAIDWRVGVTAEPTITLPAIPPAVPSPLSKPCMTQ